MLLKELLELYEAKQPSEMTKGAISKELDSIENKYEDKESLPPKVLKRHTDLSNAFQNEGWKDKTHKGSKASPEDRVTARKSGGDDSASWAVFVDGKMKINGLTKREATFYKTKFMKELK